MISFSDVRIVGKILSVSDKSMVVTVTLRDGLSSTVTAGISGSMAARVQGAAVGDIVSLLGEMANGGLVRISDAFGEISVYPVAIPIALVTPIQPDDAGHLSNLNSVPMTNSSFHPSSVTIALPTSGVLVPAVILMPVVADEIPAAYPLAGGEPQLKSVTETIPVSPPPIQQGPAFITGFRARRFGAPPNFSALVPPVLPKASLGEQPQQTVAEIVLPDSVTAIPKIITNPEAVTQNPSLPHALTAPDVLDAPIIATVPVTAPVFTESGFCPPKRRFGRTETAGSGFIPAAPLPPPDTFPTKAVVPNLAGARGRSPEMGSETHDEIQEVDRGSEPYEDAVEAVLPRERVPPAHEDDLDRRTPW